MGCTFLNNKLVSLKSVFSPDKGTLYLTHNSVAKVIDCIGISEYYIETDDEGLCLFRESSEAAVYNVDIDSVSSLMKLSKLVSDNDEYDIMNGLLWLKIWSCHYLLDFEQICESQNR